jgi:membrane associated rhomboid family serine protease/cytochrome c-type biogenesis protein CcmH/NrfG
MAETPPVLILQPEQPPVRRRRYWPVVTLVTIGITFVIFGLQNLAGGSTSTEVLLDFGAAYMPYFRQGQYWRLVMPIFLHIGWTHILLNMYALYILGPLLERVYGYGRFAFIYIGAGMASSYLSMRMSPDISAGASGAILGVAGAMLVTGFLHREVVPHHWRRLFGKILLVAIALEFLVDRLIPRIDNWGHLGGLIGGMILAGLIPPPLPSHLATSEKKPSQAWVWVPIIVVALSMGGEFRYFHGTREVVRLLREGQRLHAAHHDAQALERFKQAAALQPHDARPHEALGSLYLAQNRTADAVREFEEVLKLSPDSPSAEIGLAVAYQRQGETAKANKLLSQVVGRMMSTAEGQLAVADLLAGQQQYAQAIQHYQAALKLMPDFATAHNNLAWLLATCDDPKFRNPQEALAHARRAVELSNWKQAAYIDTLAEAFYVNQDYGQAVQAQTKALALEPNNQTYKEHMARYQKAASEAGS